MALRGDRPRSYLVIAGDHPHFDPSLLAVLHRIRHFPPDDILDPQQTKQSESGLLDLMHSLLILRGQIASLWDFLKGDAQRPEGLLGHLDDGFLDFGLHGPLQWFGFPGEAHELAAGFHDHLGGPLFQQQQGPRLLSEDEPHPLTVGTEREFHHHLVLLLDLLVIVLRLIQKLKNSDFRFGALQRGTQNRRRIQTAGLKEQLHHRIRNELIQPELSIIRPAIDLLLVPDLHQGHHILRQGPRLIRANAVGSPHRLACL